MKEFINKILSSLSIFEIIGSFEIRIEDETVEIGCYIGSNSGSAYHIHTKIYGADFEELFDLYRTTETKIFYNWISRSARLDLWEEATEIVLKYISNEYTSLLENEELTHCRNEKM